MTTPRCRAQIDGRQIEEMELSIQFTMKVKDWRVLMDQTGTGWPSWVVGQRIADVLGHITRSTDFVLEKP